VDSEGNVGSVEVELVQEVDDNELGFHERHVLTDAAPGTSREGDEAVGLFGVCAGLGPSVGVEDLGVVVVFGVVHQAQNVATHHHVLRNIEGTNLNIFLGHSCQSASCRRPHAQDLVDEVLGELHFLNNSS
jgi:hypothetical protein